MPTNNPWLTPYQRSFNSIKQQLINQLRVKVPEVTDYTEGNILILIISIFAAIAEVIHYYIDNIARETFFSTARRYSSLYKHAKLVDYHIKAGIPASVDLVVSFEDGGVPENNIEIPAGTQWVSKDGKIWINTKSITWIKEATSVTIPIVQKYEAKTEVTLGTITYQGIAIELGNIPGDQFYVEGSMKLKVNGESWTLVDTFAYSGSLDKVYKVELNDAMIPTIYFGDNMNGRMPDIDSKLVGSYYLTYGEASNIEANSFATVPSEVQSIYPQRRMLVHQLEAASGGSDYEGFAALKKRVPLSIKTLGVAITKEDYENLAMLQDGVLKAYADYICGRYVRLFIVPDNYGIASNWLLEAVQAKMEAAKVITTSIKTYPVYLSRLRFNIEIYGKKSFTQLEIHNQVKQALLERYSWNNAELNQEVRLSDVYALIDNLPTVDYLNIQDMYLFTEPFLSNAGTINASPKLNLDHSILVNRLVEDSNNLINSSVIKMKVIMGGGTTGYTVRLYFPEGLGTWVGIGGSNTITIGPRTWTSQDFTDLDKIREPGYYVENSFAAWDKDINIYIGPTSSPIFGAKVRVKPSESIAYNSGDEYTFYFTEKATNISTKFEADSPILYLPVFLNKEGDLKLTIHETV